MYAPHCLYHDVRSAMYASHCTHSIIRTALYAPHCTHCTVCTVMYAPKRTHLIVRTALHAHHCSQRIAVRWYIYYFQVWRRPIVWNCLPTKNYFLSMHHSWIAVDHYFWLGIVLAPFFYIDPGYGVPCRLYSFFSLAPVIVSGHHQFSDIFWYYLRTTIIVSTPLS